MHAFKYISVFFIILLFATICYGSDYNKWNAKFIHENKTTLNIAITSEKTKNLEILKKLEESGFFMEAFCAIEENPDQVKLPQRFVWSVKITGYDSESNLLTDVFEDYSSSFDEAFKEALRKSSELKKRSVVDHGCPVVTTTNSIG